MFPSEFGYFRPKDLGEALDFLEREDARPLAGGQSLIPMLKLRVISTRYVVDLNPISSLSYVKDDGEVVRVGAMTRHAEIVKNPLIRSEVPLLHDAARQVGDMQVRNMGTIGGSVSNADPAADYPAVLTALEAKVVVKSRSGEREVQASDFFKGAFNTDLRRGEVVKEVVFPKMRGYVTKYVKVVRRAGDYAMVSLAFAAKVKDGEIEDVRLSYSGVSDRPVRAREAEKQLVGKVETGKVEKALEMLQVNPPSDVRGSSWYRREVMKVITMKVMGEVS